jgi:hypothetical protein
MEMLVRNLAVLAATIAVLLASAVRAEPVDPQKLSAIQKIVLLGPPNPKEFVVTTAEGRKSSYTVPIITPFAIGVVSGATKTAVEATVEVATGSTALSLGRELRRAIEDRLEAQDYEVTSQYVADRRANKLIRKYGKLKYDGDAYLDLAIEGVAFDDLNPEKALCPRVRVTVLLWDRLEHEKLFEDTLEYACQSEGSAQLLPVGAQHRFKDHYRPAQNPSLAEEALRSSVPAIADHVAAMFKKPTS